MKREIIHKDLSYEIVGACFKVQNNLSRFCRERQYADELEKELSKRKINYQREVLLDKILDSNVKENYYQMQRYLRCSNLKLGLIVNFRETYLKPKRVINSEYDKNTGDIRGIRMYS